MNNMTKEAKKDKYFLHTSFLKEIKAVDHMISHFFLQI